MANRVTIIIDANGRAYIEGMEQVEGSMKKMESETKSLTSQIKAHWMSVVAAVYAMKKAWDLADMAAQFEEQKQGLNSLASQYGTTADTMIDALQRAADGTIAKMDAITVANRGLLMGLDPAQLEKFTYAAKRLSGILGGDTAAAFERLTQATAAGQERTLKSIGILVDLQGEYKKYGRDLTQAEQQTVNFNAVSRVLDDALLRMGPDTDTAADAMERFTATAKDAGLVIGKGLITAVSYTVGALMTLSQTFWAVIGGMAAVLAEFVSLGEKLPWAGDKFRAAADAVREFQASMETNAEIAGKMADGAFRTGTAIWKEAEAIKGLGDGIKKANAEIEKTAQGDAFTRGMAELARKEEELWRERDRKIEELRRQDIEKRGKEQDEMIEKERAARIEAFRQMAELERDNPYAPAAGDGEAAKIYEGYQTKLAMIYEYNGQVIQAMVTAGENQVAVQARYVELENALEDKKRAFKIQAAGEAFGVMANIMQNFYVASGSRNRAMFEAMKVFAIAEATVSTYTAAINSYKSASAIPLVGHILGPIAFAAAIAAGTASIRNIASTHPGSATGTISASGSANPSYGGGSYGAYPPVQPVEQAGAEKKPMVINIHINGNVLNNYDALAREIIPSIKKAVEDNVY